MKRLVSTILILATLVGCLAVLPLTTSARENGQVIMTIPVEDLEKFFDGVLNQNYASAQDKLDGDEHMQLYAISGSKELWANNYTGEVYVKDTQTGEILASNPYSLDGMTTNTRAQVMSQIMLEYVSTTSVSTAGTTMYSFTEAAKRGQIEVVQIKDGIRLNYVMGDTTKRYAMPYGIMASDYLDMIMVPLQTRIVEEVYEFFRKNGFTAPEHIDANVLDYEQFCRDWEESYKTIYKYGKEYTYGNIEAFDEWMRIMVTEYGTYYRRTGKIYDRTEKLSALFDDFVSLNAVYIEVSAYYNVTREEAPYPNQWSVYAQNLTDYPVLDQKGTHGDWEGEYYINSIFALDTTLTARQLRKYESLFSSIAPYFTMDDITAAEEETGVSPQLVDNPVFYLSLEYTITEDGVQVSMPATSLVYDESKYIVNAVSILPYMGTGRIAEGGYVFYPDGSGAITEFEDYLNTNAALTGKVYGQDYAYYSISGQHQQGISMPVYGTVTEKGTYYFKDIYNEDVYQEKWISCSFAEYSKQTYTITYTLGADNKIYAVYPFGVSETPVTYYVDENGRQQPLSSLIADKDEAFYYATATTVVSGAENFKKGESTTSGYLAILEEGASLATLKMSLTAARQHPYSSIYPTYVPRAKDSYDLADSIDAVTASATFTVLAERRYTGNYVIQYVMLTSDKVAEECGVVEYYPATYVGMATAYRQYLIDNGVLTALSEADIEEGLLPLFIESFGVTQTTKKFLSVPFTVDVPLTTFEDIETMYKELKDSGISNIKFRLTGFTNGGMNHTYPTKLKWERKAGGKSGYKDLIKYVESENTGVELFPNFDFFYIGKTKRFDGINPKKVGARSVDNRYAFQKVYDSVYQTFTSEAGVVVNASVFSEMFAKLDKKYSKLSKYGDLSISLDYAASDLSSDFSEENELNREQALVAVQDFFRTVRESGYSSVMSTGGNAYAFAYVDYLLKAPIDSSHYTASSYTIPFWGMVVHGYISYAGSAFNEEADKAEALLHAIESGASLYFLLSYQNTDLMKDNLLLNKYYSVNYQISKETVKEYYNTLNALIGDLQLLQIVDHKVLSVERLIRDSEKAAQLATLQAEFLAQLETSTLAAIEAERALIRDCIDLSASFRADQNWEQESTTGVKRQIGNLITKYASTATLTAIVGVNPDASDNNVRKLVYDAINDGRLTTAYGKTIGVKFDTAAILADAAFMTYVDTVAGTQFEADILAYIAEAGMGKDEVVDIQVSLNGVDYESAYSYFTYSDALDEDYVATEATIDDGSVVLVTYFDGEDYVHFILNYNIFTVTINLEGVTLPGVTLDAEEQLIQLPKYGYIRLD